MDNEDGLPGLSLVGAIDTGGIALLWDGNHRLSCVHQLQNPGKEHRIPVYTKVKYIKVSLQT